MTRDAELLSVRGPAVFPVVCARTTYSKEVRVPGKQESGISSVNGRFEILNKARIEVPVSDAPVSSYSILHRKGERVLRGFYSPL